MFTLLSVPACVGAPSTDDPPDPAAVDVVDQSLEAAAAATPSLRVTFAGGGIGEVTVNDAATGDTLATCTTACTVAGAAGQALEITAVGLTQFGGLSGACTTADEGCSVTLGAGRSTVTASFGRASGEVWSRFVPGGELRSAAFDRAGSLIVSSDTTVSKLSGTGRVVWQLPLAVCAVATGPNNTIYAQTLTHVMRLNTSGATLWSVPLDPRAVGCGRSEDYFDGFVHNLAVGRDGSVAIHGDHGVARWDASGALLWSVSVDSFGSGFYGVGIDPQGVVFASALNENGESTDLARIAADGTLLDRLEHVTSQYHGMFVIDPVGRLLATASGHGHVDLPALGQSIDLSDPDFAPNGVAAAASDVAWLYEHSDTISDFGRVWTMNRYRADGTLASSFTAPIASVRFDDFGTNPHDIAGSLDGRVAVAGALNGREFSSGWVTVFDP